MGTRESVMGREDDREDLFNSYHGEIARNVRRNAILETISQVVLRMGWILKNETIVVAGFIYHLTASPWALSIQPIVGRICPNLPQLLVAGRVGALRRKKPFLLLSMLAYALCWGSLAAIIFLVPGLSRTVLLVVFLGVYILFRLAQGFTILTRKTLEGKLIPANRRGRVIALGAPIFGVYSVLAAWFLYRMFEGEWLPFPLSYGVMFAAGSGLFGLAMVTTLMMREPAHPEKIAGLRTSEVVRAAVRLLLVDRNYLRLVMGTALVAFTFFLSPHYRAFGSDVLKVPEKAFLGFCLPAQYVAQAVGFLLIGYAADVKGNRWALCLTAWLTPLVALTAVALGYFRLPQAYFLLYGLIGVIPMFMRLVPNYILEISRPEEHALYLAAFNTTRMVGAFLSFAVGGAIVWLGHLWVFLIVMVITAVGAWCMLGLIEPRERRRPEFEPEPREL